MLLAKHFIKTLPKGRSENIFKKLAMFEKQLLESENVIRKLPLGYYVRCIKNTNVFKFRLNNKDRILYTYTNNNIKESSEVIFLQYVTHDEQVRTANNINTDNIHNTILDINKNVYLDDDYENTFDNHITQYCENGFIDLDLVPSIVVPEEKLAQLATTNDEEYLYYLSNEQYNIINSLKRRVLLTGAGGTGKTVVLHNILAYTNENKLKTLYVTYNDLLLDSTQNMYRKFINESLENCDFYTMRNLELNCCSETETVLITHEELINWVDENKYRFKNLANKDTFAIAVELNGILFGSKLNIENAEYDFESLELQQYLELTKNYSLFNNQEKESIYTLGQFYIKWLRENNLTDENQLIDKICINKIIGNLYDYVIVDEVQDLNEKQIYFLNEFVKNTGCVIWSGDVNQIISPTLFSYSNIKSMYFNKNEVLQQVSMNKNYRTTTEIINFLNDITKERINMLGKTPYDYEQCAIRNGTIPCILDFKPDDVDTLLKYISNKHYCALIVPNNEVKKDIIFKYPEVASRIFTLYEIKGLEYENIICYNIISTFRNIWNDYISKKNITKEIMRYYINMIYVASSRAKDNLNIYEDSIDSLIFEPYKNCKILTEFNEQEIGFNKNSTSTDWQHEAIRLDKCGQSDKAKLIRNIKLEKTIANVNINSDNFFSKMYNNVSKVVNVNTPFDEAAKQGIICFRQRNYTEALKIFNSLLDDYAQESDLFYYIANCYCYMTMGRHYSYRYFWNAIKLNPRNYKCYLDMAAVLNSTGNYYEALDILETAHKITPEYGNAYEIMSNVYYNIGDISSYIKFIRKSQHLPKFTFDDYNKIWLEPTSKACTLASSNTEDKVEVKHNTINLPYGVEYIKVDANGIIEECINQITFKEVKYNKLNKRYNITFHKELCIQCDHKHKCIFNKSDKYNKISIKEIIIKNIVKSYNEASPKKIVKTEHQLNNSCKDLYVKNLIDKLNTKYGDNFQIIDNKDSQFSSTGASPIEDLIKLFENNIKDIFD